MYDIMIFNGYADRGSNGVVDIQVLRYEGESDFPFYVYYNDGNDDDARYDLQEFVSRWGNRFYLSLDDYKLDNWITANEVLSGKYAEKD